MGGTLYVRADNLVAHMLLADTVYGYLVTVGAYTPGSGVAMTVTLHAVRL